MFTIFYFLVVKEHSEHPRSAPVNRKQKRKSKPTDGPPAKRKVQEAAAEDDAIDKALPFFQGIFLSWTCLKLCFSLVLI